MAVVYNSNQVKYGGRGYLDAKMQPVNTLADLPKDITEVFDGMTVVVLNDGSGKPHDYWRVNGQWVKKDNEDVAEAVSALSETVSELQAQVDAFKDTDELTNYYDKEKIDEKLDDAIDASADYTDEMLSAVTANLETLSSDTETLKTEVSGLTSMLDGFDSAQGSVKDYVDSIVISAVTSVYKVKGSVETYEQLPSEGVKEGDVYNVETECVVGGKPYPAGTNWVWVAGTPGRWDPLGGTVDMSVVDDEVARAVSAETYLQEQIDEKQATLEAGDFIKIENNVVSVTGITPEEYAKKAEVDQQIAETREGAIVAATAWTVNQNYAKEEDVIDTVADILDMISASTASSTSQIEALSSALTQEVEARQELSGRLDDEIDRATQKDAELDVKVNGEISRAESAETQLQSAIDAVSASVTEESNRAKEAEGTLKTSIEDETERATFAESLIEDTIDNISSSITSLATAISDEAERAKDAEDEVYNLITSETAAREEAVSELASAITTASAVLKEELTAAITVGGVSAGTVFSAGTSLEYIISKIFANGDTPIDPSLWKYAYYGSVDDSERMYEDNPLPEEEFSAENIKARLTKSSGPITANDEFEFIVNADDNQIVIAIPSNLAIRSATDVDNNLNYTGAFDGIVDVVIDAKSYKAYYIDSDAGFGRFKMKITLKNA